MEIRLLLPKQKSFIINNKYESDLCLTREFKEEIGLDINSDKFNYNIKYIKYPNIIEINWIN